MGRVWVRIRRMSIAVCGAELISVVFVWSTQFFFPMPANHIFIGIYYTHMTEEEEEEGKSIRETIRKTNKKAIRSNDGEAAHILNGMNARILCCNQYESIYKVCGV